jgi:hypothetical protein
MRHKKITRVIEDQIPMNLPRLVPAVIVTLLLQSSVMQAAKNASCTFDTFSAPSGYSFSQVQGVSDDGTVVGQLIDNKTLQYVAFMRSQSGVFTEYAVPKSSSTWLYGRNGSGDDAGFYQDTTNPEHVHGFLLQSSKLTVVNYPKAANTWLFDVNQLGDSVGGFSASSSVVKGFMLVNGDYTIIAYPDAPVAPSATASPGRTEPSPRSITQIRSTGPFSPESTTLGSSSAIIFPPIKISASSTKTASSRTSSTPAGNTLWSEASTTTA